MALRIPIGIDDFRTLREAGLEYVDKSDLLRGLIDRPGVEVVLLPRPRRFGKTLKGRGRVSVASGADRSGRMRSLPTGRRLTA